MADLIELTSKGLFCAAGQFYIDPWRPVERALITHAHSDHARSGSSHYLAVKESLPLLSLRLGAAINIQTLNYGETINCNGVNISFHPAGHILGSAQIRVEYKGEVWVASGDYKLCPDPTCLPFETVACHTFITESTFALPIFTWRSPNVIFDEINQWWLANKQAGVPSVIAAYSLGKAERILKSVDSNIGEIYGHGAVCNLVDAYREAQVILPNIKKVALLNDNVNYNGALILAPPSALGSTWMRRFPHAVTAMASGWMQLRGARRRRGVQKGFVLSDHADWPGLLKAIASTGCERIIITHGYKESLQHYLKEKGFKADLFSTEYATEENE